MADLAFPTALVGTPPGVVQGRIPLGYTAVSLLPAVAGLKQDFRQVRSTTGTISDQVVLKAAGVDLPFANGRVWLLRLADGYKAWEGWSDAAGNYTATGLELGVEYVAVAIDPLRNFKTVGAGPVTAV